MTLEDIKKAEEMLGPDAMHQIEDENVVAIEALKTVVERIGLHTRVDWLYNREWEDALVPIRLPKGMVGLLEALDDGRLEAIELPHCKGCRRRDGCLLLKRKISEILLTSALKLAVSRVDMVLKGVK